MTTRSWEQRRLASEHVWVEIRRRIEQFEREPAAPAAEDLSGLWHSRAVELAAAPDRDSEAGEVLTVVVLRQLTDPPEGASPGPKKTLKLCPSMADLPS